VHVVLVGDLLLCRPARPVALLSGFIEPPGDCISRAHSGDVQVVVLEVGYRFDVRPGKVAAVEDEEEPALGVVRVEEGVSAYDGAVAHTGGIAHPRRPVPSVAGIACIDAGLAVAQWELDPDVAGAGDVRIWLFSGLELHPANGISRTAGCGCRYGDFEWEGGRNGRYRADADDGRVELCAFRLCDVVHFGKAMRGHGEVGKICQRFFFAWDVEKTSERTISEKRREQTRKRHACHTSPISVTMGGIPTNP
jgi:hypothetical protein